MNKQGYNSLKHEA